MNQNSLKAHYWPKPISSCEILENNLFWRKKIILADFGPLFFKIAVFFLKSQKMHKMLQLKQKWSKQAKNGYKPSLEHVSQSYFLFFGFMSYFHFYGQKRAIFDDFGVIFLLFFSLKNAKSQKRKKSSYRILNINIPKLFLRGILFLTSFGHFMGKKQ